MSSSSSKSGNLPVTLNSSESSDADYWERHLENWNKSGLTQAEYCRRHNLNYNKFCKWKERFSQYYPSRSSVKLVEVKRDFTLNTNTPSFGSAGSGSRPPKAPNGSNAPGPVLSPSGIRFWCGEFCIEVGVQFSSSSLSQLLGTLQELRLETARSANSAGGVERVGSE